MALGVKLYIVLVISCDISKLQRLYFKSREGLPMNETFGIRVLEGERVQKVIIGYTYMMVIHNVEVKTVGGRTVYVRHYIGADGVKHYCNLGPGDMYICSNVGKFLVVQGKDLVIGRKPEAEDIHSEKFVGCFKRTAVIASNELYAKNCSSFCKTPLYGLKFIPRGHYEVECLCVQNLNEIDQVTLKWCSRVTSDLQIGFGDHFAVYRQYSNTSHEYATLSWDCIYNLENCPDCPEGRTGIQCELINCADNNGNCGDSKCESISPWTDYNVSRCLCTRGFLSGPFQCEDVDECLMSLNSCDENTTKCVNSPGSYTCECAHGFKRLNEFKCEKDHEKDQEKELAKEQDKEQEKENKTEQKQDPKAEMTSVYTGAGLAFFLLCYTVIVYIYFKKKSSTIE